MSRPNPAIKPGGASFPVFTGSTNIRAYPWGDKGEDLVIAIQFDFGSTDEPMYQSSNGVLTFNNFQVNPRQFFGTRNPKPFKSLLISADFDPASSQLPPYAPIMIQESSMGQLLYIGNSMINAKGGNGPTAGAIGCGSKISACFDLLVQPDAVFAFSQGQAAVANDAPPPIETGLAGSNVAAGTAFLTTFRMQPFIFAQNN